MRKITVFMVIAALALIGAFSLAMALDEPTKIPIVGYPVNGKSYVSFIDEDDMSSNSPYAVPSQQSVKAYVNKLAADYNVTEATDYTAGTGYSLTATILADYSTFFVDVSDLATSNITAPSGLLHGSSVTVVLPTPTAALEGKVWTIVKTDSGTTPIFLYITGGLPFNTASGTTDAVLTDAQGDSMQFTLDYSSAVSGYVVNNINR